MVSPNGETVQSTNQPLKAVGTAMATAAGAMRDGASDAVAKARQAVPAVGRFVSRAAYSSCYYVSFGVVFPTMLVATVVPGGDVLASGLLDGASAARSAVAGRKGKSAACSADEEPFGAGVSA
jgi:hypothetical protein